MYVRVTAKWCTVAVDHEGEVFESYITRTRDKAAALTLEAGNIYATHRRIWREVSVRSTAPSGATSQWRLTAVGVLSDQMHRAGSGSVGRPG
jgi:hypothetical protein